MGAPILSRQVLTGFALETVQGVAVLQSVLAVANFNLPVFTTKMTDDTPLAEREMEGSLSMLPGIPGATAGKATFVTEMIGGVTSDITPPLWGPLIQACGFIQTIGASDVTYALQTGVFNTATIFEYKGTTGIGGTSPTASRLRQIYGAMGTCKMMGKIGETVKMDWAFDGVYTDGITPVVPASIAFQTAQPPRVLGITLTIGGTSYVIPEIEMDLGNKVELRESVSLQGSAATSGYYTAVITARKPLFKVSAESLAYATQNWSIIFRAGTTLALNIVIGSTAGNTITITAPALQIGKAPNDQDVKDVLHDELEFQFSVNGSAADTELVIATS